jgi:hypothetical protein
MALPKNDAQINERHLMSVGRAIDMFEQALRQITLPN